MSRSSDPGGERPGGARSGERSEPGRAEPGSSPPRGRAGPKRKFTRADKDAILAELEESGESVPVFAAKRGLSGPTLYTWRHDASTVATERKGPRKAPSKGKAAGAPRRTYNADERRQAVEAYRKSGMGQRAFAKLYGVTESSLGAWSRRYEKDGPRRSRITVEVGRRDRAAHSRCCRRQRSRRSRH